MVHTVGKIVWQFITKLSILLAYDLAVMFFMENLYLHRAFTCMFGVALFITAKFWEPPKCSLVGK